MITPYLKKTIGAAVGAAMAGLILANSQAQAFIVNVSGLNYDVTTFTGSYNANVSKFQTAANGGVMPWWGSQANASAFASALGSSLGFSNFGTLGPLFIYQLVTANTTFGSVYDNTGAVISPFGLDVTNASRVLAQATLVPAAVPAPLPALGLAAFFGFSGKLRKRIKSHMGNSDISESPGG